MENDIEGVRALSGQGLSTQMPRSCAGLPLGVSVAVTLRSVESEIRRSLDNDLAFAKATKSPSRIVAMFAPSKTRMPLAVITASPLRSVTSRISIAIWSTGPR